jgi:hypothetical protein
MPEESLKLFAQFPMTFALTLTCCSLILRAGGKIREAFDAADQQRLWRVCE